LQLKTQEPRGFGNEASESLCSVIGYLVETEINIFDVNGIPLKCLAKNDQSSIVYPVRKVVLIVSLDLNVNRIIFIVGFFQIGAESFVGLDVCLLAHFTVLGEQLSFY
jgi:hypothetical protein